jgi:hypothetical protein
MIFDYRLSLADSSLLLLRPRNSNESDLDQIHYLLYLAHPPKNHPH